MTFNYFQIFESMRVMITVIASLVMVKYYIYLVFAPLYLVQTEMRKLRIRILEKKHLIDKVYEPLVSIIIPAWNEEVGIVTTIESVWVSTYQNIEIVVVNDGSTDQTDVVVKNWIRNHCDVMNGKTIKYFKKKNGGKGSALNFGIKHASGEIIVTMDADSAHKQDAIYNLVQHFKDPSVNAAVGNVKVKNVRNLVGLIQQMEYLFGFYFKRVHSVFDAEYIFGGACAAFRRCNTFDKIGYFDTVNKTEDIEYSMRVKLNGLKSIYAEDVVVYTEGANDLKGLYKQRLRWKKGRIDTFFKYNRLFLSRDKKHSKFLTFIVLPYAVLGEFQTLLEPLFFTAIWTYTFVSGDYLSAGISSLFILFTYISAIVFGDKETNRFEVLLFPFTWLMFYILVGVELLALLKSIELIWASQEIEWQSWDRKGIGAVLVKERRSARI
jgi:poly-beta-1,6-N-acetyl-D-glucosamine synthase